MLSAAPRSTPPPPQASRIRYGHYSNGGADANARADMGQTPLHMAESAAIARLLVDAGADPELVDDEHGTPPLSWARVGIDIHGDSPGRLALVRYLEDVTAG